MATLSRVVALGGGTGLPNVLRALRQHLPSDCVITAVVTAADSGGSSGVLRARYGVLPPGDIRNCLIALARVAPETAAALQYPSSQGPRIVAADLLDSGPVVRHAPEKLGPILCDLSTRRSEFNDSTACIDAGPSLRAWSVPAHGGTRG